MILTTRESDLRLLKASFREFYFNHGKEITGPAKIQNREFGFMGFNGAMKRHLGFSSLGGLVAALVLETPSDVFTSNAQYDFPTFPITEKGWRGAELIFDIDLKDLDLECKQSHSYAICSSCGSCHILRPEKSCPMCRSVSVHSVVLPCDNCIKGLKNEVRKLHHLLVDDLGIDPETINTYFSGNNGFHVHVLDEAFADLNGHARADLAGYLMGTGLLTEVLGVRKDSRNEFRIKFPLGGMDYGWRKRICERLGISVSSQKKLARMIEQLGGINQFKARINEITNEMGIRIDSQVTTDIHRVFRLSGTLNGKSGLTKTLCTDLNSFDPFDEPCQLSKREVAVKVLLPQLKIRFKGERYNISNEDVSVPLFVAVYLISKGLAHAL